MVGKFKSLQDVEKYLEDLRRCLSEDQYLRNYDIDVDTSGSTHYKFKTITGITNNVVADALEDTLTLASGNATLGIVGTTATDTITWTWAHLGIESLADAGADRILFWDDSETASKWLAPNAALEISTTNLNVKYDGTTIGLNGSNQLYAVLSGLTHNLFSATHPDTVAASPVLGDIPYSNVTPNWTKLAGNITTTKKFLSQTGTGSVSAVPSWETLAVGDLPAHQLDSATYHTVSGLTAGHFLKATGATTFGFAAHGLTYSDVGAAASSHAHAASEITSGTLLHERGGLEADVSAYSGLVKISAGTTSAVTDSSSNWNTAYGWGDHSLAGYLTSVTAHDLLSATHGDTLASGVSRGSLIYGNSTPAWAELAVGVANRILGSDGTDAAWVQAVHGAALTGLGDDDHTQYLLASGTRGLSAAWDAGSWQIRAETFQSDVATGTAPLTVASTTVVPNLNADLWDGYQFADYLDQAVKQTSGPAFDHISTPAIMGGLSFALADDTAGSFTAKGEISILFVMCYDGSASGIIHICPSVPSTGIVAAGSVVKVTTGVLTGTTGTDGFFTVSCHTDGKVYLENRLGGAISWVVNEFGRT